MLATEAGPVAVVDRVAKGWAGPVNGRQVAAAFVVVGPTGIVAARVHQVPLLACKPVARSPLLPPNTLLYNTLSEDIYPWCSWAI